MLYFSADDDISGTELWKSDGTATGTRRLTDINPGNFGSYPSEITNVGGTAYFSAVEADGNTGGLWTSDGTRPGTTLVADVHPFELTNASDTLYFRADDGSTGAELWKSDGTAAGTTLVADINLGASSDPVQLTVVGQSLYFGADDGTNGRELWKVVP